MKLYFHRAWSSAFLWFWLLVLFIILSKVVPTFDPVNKTLCVISQMKATEQRFPVLLFILLYKVVQRLGGSNC